MERARRRVLKVWIDQGARPDPKIDRIVAVAAERRIPVERVPRPVLDRMTQGRVHNGVVAEADDLPSPTTRELLDEVHLAGRHPFLVLADEVSYEHNLGAILRSGLGFGVDGVIVPTRRGAEVGPVVQRVSMGAAEVVPVVREALTAALKPIRDADVRVVGADMDGISAYRADLRGPVALLLGGEGKGLSPTLRKKCDLVVSIPLAGGLESLNVSVAAALLMAEKRRQDGWFGEGR